MFWLLKHMWTQNFPPPPTWSVDDIPDQTGRVHLVTGGNGGLGFETVKALLKKNATVYIATRNRWKAGEAILQLRDQTGREARFLELDLASLDSVKRAATTFLTLETELHVLYNNAGVMFPDISLLTADGYDLQFGTNMLGHFYLTKLLMPALKAGKARIVNLSSIVTLYMPSPTSESADFDSLRDGELRRKSIWWGYKYEMYCLSKLAMAIHAKELNRLHASDGITAIAVNPGTVDTGLFKDVPILTMALIFRPIMHPASRGCITQLFAGTAPEAATLGGKYLVPWARVGEPSPKIHDEELTKRLWDWMEDQVARHERGSEE